MAEFEEDIMMEDMGDFQGDPEPKLSESNRRKLDSIVQKMIANKESEEAIQFVVNDFKGKYSTKPLVASANVVTKQPEKGREMASVFGKQPTFGAAAVGVGEESVPIQVNQPGAMGKVINRPKALASATKAQKKLLDELQVNDDVIEQVIRQERFDIAGREQEVPTSETQITGMRSFEEPKVKPQDLPVTPEDIQLVKSDAQSDEMAARKVLNDIATRKPEKKKDIQSSVYWVDAVRSARDNDARLPKIIENAKSIEKGDLIYDVRTGNLMRPQGVAGSLITGWKQKSQLFDDYSFLNSKPDEEIITELERRRTDSDIDEPIPVPKHKIGELSQMLGSMPLKSIIAGAGISALGAPEAAPFVAGAVGSVDFYRMGYAATLQNEYYKLREQGVSEQEALEKARSQAKKEAAIDAATGAVMSFVGARIGMKPLNFSQGYKSAIFDFAKKSAKEGGIQGAFGGLAEYSKNKLAQAAGLKRDTDENILNAIESNFLLTMGMAAAAKLGSGIPKVKYRSLLNGLKNVPDNVLEGNITSEINAGRLTEQQANNIRNEIKSYKELDSQIPENVTEEARLEIQKKLERRNELEGQLESLNKAFHPEIKEKITKLDEEITELSKQREPKVAEDKDAKEVRLLIDDAINEGQMTDLYAMMAKENPEGFMKFVADQSFGRTESGEMSDIPNTEYAMREQFGDAIVDKAKEMFPLEEKKSSISVIRPEEQKQTETITIKPKEDAVSVKSAAEVPVRETSGDSGHMAEGIRAAEESAGKEAGQESIVAGEEGVGGPPAQEGRAGIYVQRPGVELSHKGLQDVANEFSLPDVQSRERVSDVQLRTDAEIQAKEWADKGEYASNIERLTQEAEKGKVLTDKERVIMEQHLANVMGDARAIADKTSPEYAAKFAEISRLKKAGEKTRSAAGAALRISGQRSTPTDAPEDMIIAKEEAIGRPTTPEEKEKTSQQFEKIDKAKKSFSAKGKQIADRIRALRPKTDSAQSQLFGLAVGVYDTALVTIANAVEAGANLADAIQAGISYIKQEGGFKNKKDEKTFAAYIKGQLVYDEKLQAFKARTKSSTEKLKQKTAEKDFEPDVRPILELDEEARQLKNEYRQAKYEFELELQKDKLRQRPFHKKAIDALLEPLRSVRTILTSFDFSAPLRQGIVPTISHPTVAAKAFPEMFKQAFSKTRFDEWLSDLKESPVYDVMDKSGLYIADPNSLHLSAKEENFMSNLAEKIPIVGRLVKGSERAYVSYLNKMRADLFKQGIEVFMQEGKTIQNSPELYEGLANFINNSTGRGKLGPLEGSADFLNTVFFSPRLMASRMNMLGLTDIFTAGQKGFYSQLPKEVRVMAMKDMLKFIGFGTSVLALSKLAGADVEDDPRSTDFGKIKIGDTRYDIWGGFQGYVRLIAQMASGKTKTTTTGEVKELKPEKRFGERPITFFRGKLAPIPGSVVDLMMGKNVIGEPVTLQGEALESITPMIYRDVKEAMEDQGIKAIFSVGVPAAFGIGANTYDDKEKKPSSGRGERGKRGERGTRASRN